MRYLQGTELLDDLTDGVDGLSVGQEAAGCRDDDVEGTLLQLSGVSPVQLPGPEHTLDAVPAHTHTHVLNTPEVPVHSDSKTVHTYTG